MTIRVGDPFTAFTYVNHIKGSHSIEVVYFATFVEPIDKIVVNPEDHSEYGWFRKDEGLAARSDIVPADSQHVAHEQTDDPEYLTILKGFEILSGVPLNTGNEVPKSGSTRN